ncbi:unnamed protein product [Ilex paraguariensis]|uniref:Growth-regulating factor n=1 Tax=Ilex paraguariensis TaxID=185542 RepID=A0ABC8S827_9AQUA
MSGASTSVSVAVAGGGEGYFRPPFTAVQWQELEHQALIYKYLVAGLPVPPDLVDPIRRSFEALSARFFHHPSLGGYCSYYGKKFDPEPGRCRRTDGKKWRCSKDAYPDSKYCERHMHRGRNRSRKPVESQPTAQSLSTGMSHIATDCSSGSGSFKSSGSGTFQNLPLFSVVNAENLCFGTNVSKLQMEPGLYGISNKDYRYLHGTEADEHNFSPEVSGSVKGLEMDSNIDSPWRLMSSQVPSSPFLKPRNNSHFPENSPQLQIGQAFEPTVNATMSKQQQQQHCFFSSDIGSIGPVGGEQHSVRPFFDEWPKHREAWSNLDGEKSNENACSTTQLSISIPTASSEFSLKNAGSSDGADA